MARVLEVQVSGKRTSDLIERYVDEILNGCDSESIGDLFAPNFRDHDPIAIPGVFDTSGFGTGTIMDLYRLVGFLSRDAVDFRFSLEQCVGREREAAYRLFGQGLIRLADERTSAVSCLGAKLDDGRVWQRIAVPGTSVAVAEKEAPYGTVFAGRLNVIYRCVGIFRCSGDRFCDRWGSGILQ